jgi:hypothetical protein
MSRQTARLFQGIFAINNPIPHQSIMAVNASPNPINPDSVTK